MHSADTDTAQAVCFPMKVTSVNVAMPSEMRINDRTVLTGIFKSPVAGLVRVRTLNLDGDLQADLTVHGGPDKAVYIYPSEHYSYWEKSPRTEPGLGGLWRKPQHHGSCRRERSMQATS